MFEESKVPMSDRGMGKCQFSLVFPFYTLIMSLKDHFTLMAHLYVFHNISIHFLVSRGLEIKVTHPDTWKRGIWTTQDIITHQMMFNTIPMDFFVPICEEITKNIILGRNT